DGEVVGVHDEGRHGDVLPGAAAVGGARHEDALLAHGGGQVEPRAGGVGRDGALVAVVADLEGLAPGLARVEARHEDARGKRAARDAHGVGARLVLAAAEVAPRDEDAPRGVGDDPLAVAAVLLGGVVPLGPRLPLVAGGLHGDAARDAGEARAPHGAVGRDGEARVARVVQAVAVVLL